MDNLNEFLNLRQGNGLVNVCHNRFLELSRYELDLTQEVTVSRLIQGLANDLKYKVEAMSPTTLAEAITKEGII